MQLPELFRGKLLADFSFKELLSRTRQATIYEVDMQVDNEAANEFDDWLKDHMREMLAFPGFQEAEAFADSGADSTSTDSSGGEPAGKQRRLVTYKVRSRRELDSYLHTHAERMRAAGKQRFGQAISASHRILPQNRYALPPDLRPLFTSDDISGGLPICSNCHHAVAGRFCTECGQEDRTYLLSLRELLMDFFGDLVNFDSRFFKTTVPLLFRPGFLTAEYIRGRRQVYFPPVRLYIFISIVFFFVASVLTDASVDETVARNAIGAGMQEPPETREAREEAIREALETQRTQLEEAGLLEEADRYLPSEEEVIARTEKEIAERKVVDQEHAGQEGTSDEQAGTGPAKESSGETGKNGTRKITLGENTGVSVEAFGIPEIDERIERGVESVKQNPKAFIMALLNDIPIMMFVFLPLIALVLKLLYFFTGRYYVEHLIFTLHYHAAVFVLMLLLIANNELASAYSAWNRLSGWIVTIIWIYIPVYLFMSMRVVYGQGRFFTGLKFILLLIAYLFAAAMTIGATVMIGLWRQG